jgi:predicted porin
MLSSSSTNTFNPGNLPSYLVSEVQSLYQTGSTSATDTDPMVEIGVGGEYSLGQDMSLFLQIEYSMIFDSGTSNGKTETATFSYIPITAGLNFDL